MLCCFFFKQKTAYEMCISDWSSDVCSSDLPKEVAHSRSPILERKPARCFYGIQRRRMNNRQEPGRETVVSLTEILERSEERRVGKECVSTGRSRGSPNH